MTKSCFYTILILVFIMSTACKPQTPQPSAQLGQADAAPISALSLMKIAFPQSNEGKCLVTLPHVDTGEPENFELEALACSPLPKDWMVLVASAVPELWRTRADGASLNLIWFKQVKGGWEMVAHEKNVARIASSGLDIGFPPLLGERVALSIKFGGIWQGHSHFSLYLCELIPEKSRLLTDGLSISSSNSGDCPSDICWTTEGKWSFAQTVSPDSDANIPDLIIQFDDTESSYTGQPTQERHCCEEPGWEVTKKTKVRAVYRYSSGSYRLIEGTNPVRDV